MKNKIEIFCTLGPSSLNKKFLKFSRKKKVHFFKSLGNTTYVSLMRLAYLVIGNSSSGVLETPSFGTSTINIGNRQNGRIISKNIINSKYETQNIIKNIRKAILFDKKKLLKIGSPFYKKDTPKKIAKKIISFKFDLKKNFNDLI